MTTAQMTTTLMATIGSMRRAMADRRGIAALEFALILPVLLLMYIGATDVSRGIMASRDVDILSRTISDLVAQQSNTSPVTSTTLSTIFSTTSAIMAPFATSPLTLTVSAVDIKAREDKSCCQALVRWTYTQGGTLRPCTTPLTLAADGTPPSSTSMPASIVNANNNAGAGYSNGATTYLIIADVTYSYTPFFPQAASWFAAGMTKTTFMVPRVTPGPIKLSSPVNAQTGQSGNVCFS